MSRTHELSERRSAPQKNINVLEREVAELTEREQHGGLSPAQEASLNRKLGKALELQADLDEVTQEWETEVHASPAYATRTVGDTSGTMGPTLIRGGDPWAAPGFYDTDDEVRSRALRAIERVDSDEMEPEHRERVAQVIRGDEMTDTAEYVTAASCRTISRRFPRSCSGRWDVPTGRRRGTRGSRSSGHGRSVNSTAKPAPRSARRTRPRCFLSLSIPRSFCSSPGAHGDFRKFSRVETIAVHTWNGVTSAGSTAEWTSELAEVTESSPVIGAQQIVPVRGDCYIEASYEVVQDSNFTTQIGMLLGGREVRPRAGCFRNGRGRYRGTARDRHRVVGGDVVAGFAENGVHGDRSRRRVLHGVVVHCVALPG